MQRRSRAMAWMPAATAGGGWQTPWGLASLLLHLCTILAVAHTRGCLRKVETKLLSTEDGSGQAWNGHGREAGRLGRRLQVRARPAAERAMVAATAEAEAESAAPCMLLRVAAIPRPDQSPLR